MRNDCPVCIISQLQQFYVNALIYYSLPKVVWQTKAPQTMEKQSRMGCVNQVKWQQAMFLNWPQVQYR